MEPGRALTSLALLLWVGADHVIPRSDLRRSDCPSSTCTYMLSVGIIRVIRRRLTR